MTKVCKLIPLRTHVPNAPFPTTKPGYTLTPDVGATGATVSLPVGSVVIVNVDDAA